MKFRPCIDLHHGQVKQIVGSTLKDDDHDNNDENTTNTTTTQSTTTEMMTTNFVSNQPSSYYAQLYQQYQ